MARRTGGDGTYVPEGIADEFTQGEPAQGESAQDESTQGGPASSGQGQKPSRPSAPALGLVGTLRWMWRQLTSMRVALMLLMLLAVAAVPGSVLPQRNQDAARVIEYLADHPTAGEWLDKAGFFDVYSSVWFSAIYILLFVSLVGCILPRSMAHYRALRGRPPRVPSRFNRFPAKASGTTTASPEDAADAVAARLRGKISWLPTFRVDRGTEPAHGASGRSEVASAGPERPSGQARPASATVSAERGYLRETGNLVFHLALVGLLVSVATGQLLHYRGQAIVTEGRGFANAVVDYDTFEKGAWFRPESLVPFSMTLDRFVSEFASDTVAFAQARDFTAHVTVTEPSGEQRPETVKVNHPLVVDGAKIYLQGNGFAPDITVRDAEGEVAFAGRVTFIPQDTMYTSRGVVKVPDVAPGLDQIGLVGYFLPTAEVEPDGSARSAFPQPVDPLLVLEVYTGDLGLDDGSPQNVYELDTASLTPALDENGARVKVLARPGQTVDLPDGLGTLTLGDELPRYVAFDLRYDPSLTFVLVFALLALGGLTVSLFTPRRRVWARAYVAQDGATVVEVAGLARGDDAGLQAEVDRALAAVPGMAEIAEASPAATSLDAPRQAQEPRVETGSEKD